MTQPKTPDPVDLFVGAKIRERRHELGLSQQGLADRLGKEEGQGISFQQVQKYERGANRVSASMMVRCADALDVEPAYFFDGLRKPKGGRATADDGLIFAAGAGKRLVAALAELPAGDRATLAQLIFRLRDLAAGEDHQAAA